MSLGMIVLLIITSVSVVFLLWVLYHFSAEARRKQAQQRGLSTIVTSAMHGSILPDSPQDQSRILASRSSRQKE